MIKPIGATSVSIDVFFADDTGAAVTGKVAADFPACKWSSGVNTADTTITLSDLAAITTAHPNDNTAGGIKEREGGWYRLDLPNTVCAASGVKTITFAEVAGKRILAPRLDVQYVQADVEQWKGSTAPAMTGDAFARIGAPVGASISADIAGVPAALLDLAAGVETSVTLRQAIRILLAASAGKLSGAATTTIVIRDTNDTKNRITATVDASGNRSAITLDAT